MRFFKQTCKISSGLVKTFERLWRNPGLMTIGAVGHTNAIKKLA